MRGHDASPSGPELEALVDRIDRQIEFIRGVPYWYVLPAWIFFVTVLISGIVKGLPVGQLLAEFGAASALCVLVIVLNVRYGRISVNCAQPAISG